MSDIDNPTITINPMKGVNLVEQVKTSVVRANEGNDSTANIRAKLHLNENSWNLQDMLGRFNYVTSVPWGTTDAVGTRLYNADVVADLLQLDIASMPFQRFTYWNCKYITMHVQLTASRFHQGRLLMSFLPSQILKTQLIGDVNMYRLLGVQHAFLDPSDGSVVEFKIPFNFYKGYLDLIAGDSLGQFQLHVFSQLFAATGSSPSVEAKIFVSLEGSNFKIPRPGGSSFARLVQKQSGVVSKVTRAVEKVIEPLNLAGDVLTAFGLDKPATSLNPGPLVRKDQQYLTHAKNVENLDKLALYPQEQQLVDAEHFATKQDEMNIKFLVSKPHFLATTKWHATDTVGTQLFSTEIGPMPPTFWQTPASIGAIVQPTSLDYVSKYFTYWRGGIKFIFDVVVSKFHEGRLDIVFAPTKDTSPPDYATSLSQYATSFTVRNGHNQFEVLAPFLSDTPWKRVYNGWPYTTTISDHIDRFVNYFLGMITLQVSVPLKNPSTVVDSVDINIFVCAADDYELSYPSLINQSIVAISDSGIPAARRVIKQSGEVGIDEGVLTPNDITSPPPKASEAPATKSIDAGNSNSDDAVKDSRSEPQKTPPLIDVRHVHPDNVASVLAFNRARTRDPKVHHFGETYTSLRDLCKRYQPLVVDSTVINPSSQGGIYGYPGNPTFTTFSIDSSTLFDNTLTGGFIPSIARSYRNYRGPLNFKIKQYLAYAAPTSTTVAMQPVANTKVEGYVSWIPDTYNGPAHDQSYIEMIEMFGPSFYIPGSVPNGHSGFIGHFTQDTVAEIQVPFLHHASTVLTNNMYENLTQYNDSVASFKGVLLVASRLQQIPNIPAANGTFSLVTEVFFSLADESHLGTFIGIPACTFKYTDGLGSGASGSSIYPDGWYIAPSLTKATIVPADSDEEFEVVRVKKSTKP